MLLEQQLECLVTGTRYGGGEGTTLQNWVSLVCLKVVFLDVNVEGEKNEKSDGFREIESKIVWSSAAKLEPYTTLHYYCSFVRD